MIRWLLILLVLASPAAAQDAGVVVARSGEHGAFTRLTLTFDRLPDWRIGRAGAGYELRLADRGYTFDVSAAFTRITRDRLAAITPAPNGDGLQVDLGCPCHLRAFVAEGRMLVLDIYPGAAPAGSPFEAMLEGAAPLLAAPSADGSLAMPRPEALAAADPVLADGAVVAGTSPPVPRRGAVLLPPDLQAIARVDGQEMQTPKPSDAPLAASSILNPTPPGLPALERFADRLGPGAPLVGGQAPAAPEPWLVGATGVLPAERPRQGDTSALAIEPAPTDPAQPSAAQPETATDFSEAPPGVGLPDPRINILRDQLVRGLGAAAARGVVEFDGPDGIDEVRARAEQALRRPEPQTASEPPLPTTVDHAQMALRTRGTDATRDRALDGHLCIPDEALAIGDWGSPETLTEDIARHRARLVAEFDKVRPAAVEALTKAYLGAGFGAEARLVLRGFLPVLARGALPDAPMLTSISHIVDGEVPPRPHAFEGQEVCDGHVALWAVLASEEVPSGPTVDQRGLERGFAALPPHLRSHLGPELVARLLKAGQEGTARNLRLSLVRAASDPGASAEQQTSLDLVDARLDIHDGQHLEAERGLGAIIEAKSPLAIQAVVEMVDSRIGRGGTLDPQEMLSLGALARENRGGPNAARLRRAEALALTMAGEPARALDEVLPPGDPVHAEVWALLARHGDDGALIAVAVPRAARARSMVPPAVREDLAARLIDLGFADAAASWLDSLTTDRALLLRARAELDRDAPRAALALLAGLQDPEATALRARALMRLGQATEAADHFAEAGMAQESQRASLQAGDIARIAAGPDERLSALAQQLGRLPAAMQPGANTAAAPDPSGDASGRAQGLPRATVTTGGAGILPAPSGSSGALGAADMATDAAETTALASGDDRATDLGTTAIATAEATSTGAAPMPDRGQAEGEATAAVGREDGAGAQTAASGGARAEATPGNAPPSDGRATQGQSVPADGSAPLPAPALTAAPDPRLAGAPLAGAPVTGAPVTGAGGAGTSPLTSAPAVLAETPLAAGRALIGAAQRDRDIIRALITPIGQ